MRELVTYIPNLCEQLSLNEKVNKKKKAIFPNVLSTTNLYDQFVWLTTCPFSNTLYSRAASCRPRRARRHSHTISVELLSKLV